MTKIDLSLIKEYLNYHKDIGIFFWKKSPSRRASEGTRAGCLNPNGYVVIRLKGKLYYAHRLAYTLIYGDTSYQIDHKDRNKSNNRIYNLRTVTSAENNINKDLCANNKSTKTGVSFSKTLNKFIAYIDFKGKRTTLGYRKLKKDAILLRKTAEIKLYGKEFPS